MQQVGGTRATLVAALAFVVVPLLFHVTIVETSHVRLAFAFNFVALFKLGFVTVSALTHWAIYTSLLMTFALTLRPGHEPLITGMARRMHAGPNGALSAELARYTRRVTIAWSGFFAVQLTTSILLFWFSPLVVWSFFVNILDIPLVVAMFAAEYACRLILLRDPPRHSLAAILSMVADIRKPGPDAAVSL